MTDYPDWQTPQAHANAIASTGVPLLALPQELLNQTALPVSAVSPYESAVIPVTQLSYDIQIQAETSSSATVPFLTVTLIWADSVTGALMPQDTYIIPASQSAFTDVAGRGPAKADTVQVQVTYADLLQTATVKLKLVQHSRPLTVDRWSWRNSAMNGQTIPNWILPVLPNDDSCLGIINQQTIAASSNESFLCGMHNGLIGVGINMNTGVLASLIIEFAPVPSSLYSTNNPLGAYMAPPPLLQIPGPRSPIRVTLVNQATTPITVTVGLFAIAQF